MKKTENEINKKVWSNLEEDYVEVLQDIKTESGITYYKIINRKGEVKMTSQVWLNFKRTVKHYEET